MFGKSALLDYMQRQGIDRVVTCDDGAFINPGKYPVAAVETNGAVLFADLPGYSSLACTMDGVECACLTNHFFAWFHGATKHMGGIIDKYIGDEVMVVFPDSECAQPPLDAAISAGWSMLDSDSWNFSPKIGIAAGLLTIALVGTPGLVSVTALGHTVNLAARCGASVPEPKTIRIATDDIASIRRLVDVNEPRWSIHGPSPFIPKNMPPVEVIDITRNSDWYPQVDFLDEIKRAAKLARDNGAIIEDKGRETKR